MKECGLNNLNKAFNMFFEKYKLIYNESFPYVSVIPRKVNKNG